MDCLLIWKTWLGTCGLQVGASWPNSSENNYRYIGHVGDTLEQATEPNERLDIVVVKQVTHLLLIHQDAECRSRCRVEPVVWWYLPLEFYTLIGFPLSVRVKKG